MTTKPFMFLFAFLFAFSALAIDTNPDAVVGTWLNGEGTGHIQIYKQGDKYFGKLIWLKEATNPDGSEKKDINNPKKDLQNRTLKGLVILRKFEYEGGNVWEDGQIYDPKTGNDYSCKMTLKNSNTLEVRGYIGLSVFGRTDTWKRVK
ncbi:hypothetical protein SAMN06298216_1899 [Spirosomataceae bacterium TFI 002]|nr:hypothetical protein SAMN06298216_1899 [Spirosomataceae bacterium TFI 002]